jgi:4-amino-4-deoxy-L-arabinose transferase-like glycosyltransferase
MPIRRFRLAALGIVLLTIVIRLPSLQHPQAIDDEAPYSVVANEIVDGGRLYIDALDRKPPLLFWTYAAVFALAGKYNWVALHTVALLWTLGTMAGLYSIGRQLFNRETGLVAALLYGVFQSWAVAKNLAFNGEMLMNLPLVWAWSIAFRAGSSRLRPELFGAGILLCAGFLLKQPAAIAALPTGIYLLLPSYRTSRGITKSISLVHAAILTAGFFATLGLVAIVLARQAVLREAFYWTFTNHDIPHVFWETGILHTLAFIGACLPLVVGAGMAFRDRNGLWARRKAERTALLGLLIASIIGAAAGARFYPHYYIQLVPPLALLAAPHYVQLWRSATEPRFWFFRPAVMAGWLTITVLAFSISHWKLLAGDRESSETARYLMAHSGPNDRVFIWGRSAAEFYLQARRRPASRYVLTFPLTGLVFGNDLPNLDTRNRIVPGAWDNLEEDFRQHPPLLIVDLQSGSDAQYPVHDFPVLSRLLAESYELVARTAEGLVYRMRDPNGIRSRY